MNNALITRSEEARAALQQASGMDDLSYHLMILEAGCHCLDKTLQPVGAGLSSKVVELYREHLYKQGWWTWFEMFWRAFEVRIWAEWICPESLVPQQSDAWKRETLHNEASTLYYTSNYHHAFDLFIKMLEERGQLTIPIPQTAPANLTQHA